MALTDFQKTKFMRTFTLLDRNGNGVLEWDDFAHVAYSLREMIGWTEETPRFVRLLAALKGYWERILELMDSDGNGAISREEYLEFYGRFAEELPRMGGRVPEWALDLFHTLHRAVDFDNDGCISAREYALYLRALGSNSDPAVAFRHFDINGDGELDLDELEPLIAQYLTSDDPLEPGNWFVDGGGWGW